MTRDDIIRMARESGFEQDDNGALYIVDRDGGCDAELVCFAALVAAAEREACAAIAETPVTGEQDDITMEAKDRAAAAIRARGDKT